MLALRSARSPLSQEPGCTASTMAILKQPLIPMGWGRSHATAAQTSGLSNSQGLWWICTASPDITPLSSLFNPELAQSSSSAVNVIRE